MVNSEELLLILYPVAPVEPSTRVRAACREPQGREFIEPVGRTKGSLNVERQNVLNVSAGVNVFEFPERLHLKAAEESPWHGVYSLRGPS